MLHSISIKSTALLICFLTTFLLQAKNNYPVLSNMGTEDFIFPSQVNDNKYYLDLEMLEGSPSDMQILNKEQDVVVSIFLTDTPADALYELDLSEMEKGEYTIKVRTFRQEKNKDITII